MSKEERDNRDLWLLGEMKQLRDHMGSHIVLADEQTVDQVKTWNCMKLVTIVGVYENVITAELESAGLETDMVRIQINNETARLNEEQLDAMIAGLQMAKDNFGSLTAMEHKAMEMFTDE